MSTIADMVVAASTMMQPASREREGSFEGGAGPRPPRRVRSMTAPPRQFSLLANDIQYRSYLPPAPRPSLFFSSLHPDSDLLLPPSEEMPSEKEQSAESSFGSFTTQAGTEEEEEEEYDETYQMVDPEDRTDSHLYGTLDASSFSRSQRLVVFLSIFISAIGLTLPWTCILSSVSLYEMKYGDNIMVFVSSCYYIPALPIFVAQMLWDSRFDRLISSRKAVLIRISFALAGNAACLFCLQFSTSKYTLLLYAFFVGFFGSVGYGSYYQLVSFLPPPATSIFSMGLFCPTFFVLFVQILTGYGVPFGLFMQTKQAANDSFWLINSTFTCTSMLVFWFLMCRPMISFYCHQKDNALAGSTQGPNKGLAVSKTQILRAIWPSLVAIFISIYSNVSTVSLFPYVPATSDTAYFAIILTYTKNISDFIGRVLTLLPIVIRTGRSVLISGLLRGLMLPVFLYYTFGSPWNNDAFIIIFTAVVSIMAGYLNTCSYQYAASSVPPGNQPRAATIMNISFQISVYCSVLCQFALVFFLPPSSPSSSSPSSSLSLAFLLPTVPFF